MTDEVTRSAANHALLNYRQADNEGIMVEVSRQAIHMVDDEIKQLRACFAALEAEIADLRAKLAAYEGQITAEEMRERCADVADTCDSPYGCATQEQDYACSDMAYRIAAAIRAISTKREEG